MTKWCLLLGTLLAGQELMLPAETNPKQMPDAAAAFSKLKTLVGEWETTSDSPMGKSRLRYELMAGGTALVEHETFEKGAPMMTVFHLDGGRLMLTHYCMAGNQPRMQAKSYNAETGEIDFAFLDATNLKSGAGHMRNAKIRVAGPDKLVAKWAYFEGGTQKEDHAFEWKRVK